VCVHYTHSLRSVASSTFVLLLKCLFILFCRFDFVEHLHTARQEDMELCNVQDIPLKLCCRNKSHLCDPAFKMFFSSVHWSCTSWKTVCPSTAWGGNGEELWNLQQFWHWNLFFFLSLQRIWAMPGVFKTGELLIFEATARWFFFLDDQVGQKL